MRKILTLVLCALSFCPLSAALLPDTIVAFPGAEGFGKYTSGGRGGKVIYVTTLEDDKDGAIEGSLRWAIKQYPDEPLTVCFAVTGEIRLVDRLYFNRRENFTLAGQTAPGVGIVITHHKVEFGGSKNFIVRNLRFRIGHADVNGNLLKANAVGAENCENYIFDHCDFGWSTEENMNSNDSHFLTIQYCIVHEGLYYSGHPKQPRAYGCQWGGSPATYHHNLLINNNARSCRFNGAQSNDWVVYLDYINNVQYNYEGGSTGCYGGENTAKIDTFNGLNSAHECNFINNYYKVGPNTTKSQKDFVSVEAARSGATSWGPSQWYLSGNVFDGVPSATANNWSAVHGKSPYSNVDTLRVDTLIRPKTPWWRWTETQIYGQYDFDKYAYAVESFQTAEQAYQDVINNVGCQPRDHVENRLVRDMQDKTYTYSGYKGNKKGIIDLETDAEGFYQYTQVPALTDTDLDGMPDEWESGNGCDPNTPDNNVRHASGYTMLEMYLDYAIKHKEPMDDGYETATEAIEDVPENTSPLKGRKFFRDGQLFIERGKKVYTIMGIEMH